LGVLYDDHVKTSCKWLCIIKKEAEVVLHAQEVNGSSPVAPTHREPGTVLRQKRGNALRLMGTP